MICPEIQAFDVECTWVSQTEEDDHPQVPRLRGLPLDPLGDAPPKKRSNGN